MDFASTGVAFTAGSFVVYWFAVFLAAAMIAALVITAVLAKRRYHSDDLAVDLCIVCIPCGIVGGRLFAALCGQIAFSDFFRFSVWGLSLFGAVFACIGGVAVYCAVKKRRLLETLDLLTPGLFAAIAVGRWGDCLHRTAYGPLVEQRFWKWFPVATYAPDNSIRFAPFFYTFLLCTVLVALYFLLFYNKERKRGAAFVTLSAGYLAVEFFIEWLRQDRIMLLGLRFNQWMCAAGLIACVLTYFLCVRKLQQELPAQPADAAEPADAEPPSDAADAPDKTDAKTTEEPISDGSEPVETIGENP